MGQDLKTFVILIFHEYPGAKNRFQIHVQCNTILQYK